MKVLLDTNVLLRSSQPAHPHHVPAVAAVRALVIGGWTLCISSQTVYEFLAVATRLLADRGLAMSHAEADAELGKLLPATEVFYDSALVVEELRRLMIQHGVSGKSVHNARLVATMNVHGLDRILTFNGRDFARFTLITVLAPEKITISLP
jgi:predicted nucleic acid-binding protein